MAHKDWCGKPCSECSSPCSLDQSMPCSPDCSEINKDGTRNVNNCVKIACDAIIASEGECLQCRNTELSYGSDYKEDETYVYEWKCGKCGASGKEYHKLTFVTHILD